MDSQVSSEFESPQPEQSAPRQITRFGSAPNVNYTSTASGSNNPNARVSSPPLVVNGQDSELSSEANPQSAHLVVPPQVHRYTFSIDLRGLELLGAQFIVQTASGPDDEPGVQTQIQAPFFVYMRYQYAFFGSAAPVFTYPPVEVSRVRALQHSTILLPQSFCSFDFATLPSQLANALLKYNNCYILLFLFYYDLEFLYV